MRTRADKLSEMEVNGRIILRDGHGYLIEPEQWGRDVAEIIAGEENVELDSDHWFLIDYMRQFFDEHDTPPDARFVFRQLAEHKGIDKTKARKLFFELFPYGYVKQTCKIAGMRQPRAWSTG